MARKFILIDQSIASIAGHHYEYAVHVLEAAQRAGYEPFLATHVRFSKSSHHSPWRTFPIYRYGFWAAQETAQFGLVNWILGQLGWLRFRWRLFYHYSLFGLLWAVRDRFSDFLLKQPLDRAHLASLATLIPAAILLKLVRFLFLLLLLPVMLLVFLGRSAARLLRAGGFPQSYLRSLLADAADAWNFAAQVFARRLDFLSWWQQYRCLAAFRKDTARLLRDIQPAAGDIIFVPTLSGIELMGLGDYLRTRKPGPSWHLLFRRDIYPGREAAWPAEEWRVQGLRNSMLAGASKLKGHDVRFYTDTDELTAQYNRLGVFSFRTVPIPHTHTPRPEQAPSGPLRVIYVGDARREKGYHLIPHLIEDLWEDYIATGRASFRLQSNFNIPQGEPEAVIAREQLDQLARRAPSSIELLKQPMTSEQYKTLLLSGSINLLLYDSANYYSRSSGILVESLTAGIPVLVPAATWLSRQFAHAVLDYRKNLRREMKLLRRYCLPEMRWKVHGNPRESAVAAGELIASYQAKAYTRLRAVPEATHLLIAIQFQPATTEAMLYIEQLDANGNSLAAVFPRLLEAGKEGETIEILALDPRAAKLWIAAGSASPASTIALRNIEIDFLAAPPNTPLSAAGCAYQHPAGIAPMLRELIDHHEHYSRTARAFSKTWHAYHNAASLIAELGGRAGK